MIFFVCLVIATVLWFVNVLGKSFETEVSMPINYVNLPKNKVLINAPPSALQVRIEAHGFTLLRNRLRLSLYPVNFNLKTFISHSEGTPDNSNYQLASSKFLNYISKQIGSEITIIDISPDTLYFEFDQVVEQKKAVRADFQMTFANQFFQYDSLLFLPDSVTIRGPKSVLDTMVFVKTEKRRFKGLNVTTKREVSLALDGQLEAFPKKVLVTIPVSVYSEYNDRVPISVKNLPEDVALITFPGMVQVSCQVAVPFYGNINTSSFIFAVDYNDVLSGKQTLNVELINAPHAIRKLNFSPNEVEYIIQNK